MMMMFLLLLLLLLLITLPFEREAISGASKAVGTARRWCDALVWLSGATRQMGYYVVVS